MSAPHRQRNGLLPGYKRPCTRRPSRLSPRRWPRVRETKDPTHRSRYGSSRNTSPHRAAGGYKADRVARTFPDWAPARCRKPHRGGTSHSPSTHPCRRPASPVARGLRTQAHPTACMPIQRRRLHSQHWRSRRHCWTRRRRSPRSMTKSCRSSGETLRSGKLPPAQQPHALSRHSPSARHEQLAQHKPHWPLVLHVLTPAFVHSEQFIVVPGTHVPPQVAPTHAEAHAVGVPHCPSAPQVDTAVLLAHLVTSGVQTAAPVSPPLS